MRRFERWTLPALAIVCVAVTFYASAATSLSFDELGVLGAVGRGSDLVRRVAEHGFSQLLLPDAAPLLAGPVPSAFVLLSGWAKLSLGRVIDPLTSVRVPWLLITAAAPVALYGIIVPSRGRLVAVLAALTLLFLPRWLHGSVVLAEGALVGSLWLVILVAYVRSQGRGAKRSGWAVAGALATGFGTALSLATLWVLFFIAVHFTIANFRVSRRMWRKGRVPLPQVVAFSVILGPMTFFAASPLLWSANTPAIVRHVLAPLGPSVVPTEYLGRVIQKPPVPGGYALGWLFETTPLSLLLLAAVGVLSIVHGALARRFASGHLRPPRDRTALGALVVLGLLATLLGPALAPDALASFPPRVELALPFVAIAVALGLARLATWAKPERLRWLPATAVMTLFGVSTITGVRTAGAAFNLLAGRSFRVGDGSELGPLLAEIARRGGARAPDVPPALFSELASLRRMKAVSAGNASLVRLPRGPLPNAVVVRRDGVVVWALVRD